MWHPEPFVKHPIPPTSPPGAEAAARAALFSPLATGRLQLADRTWVPAMVPWRATEDGLVTPEVLAWYERFARGQPGALVVEATGIRDVPSGPLLRIGHDRFTPGLSELVRTVRRASGGRTRLFIQIIDFLRIRRRPEPERYFRQFLTITDRHRALLPGGEDTIRERLASLPEAEWPRVLSERELESLRFGERERVTDTWLPHIRELPAVLPELFARAAARAEQAGFDGVELHYAHAYTMASFLSALNQRDDGYGGPRAHRVRLPLEVHAAVRSAVGDGRRVHRRRQRRRGRGVVRCRVRPGGNGLPLALARRQVRGREAAAGGVGALPLHRAQRV
jgi:2,4-dienoyl-CoA reductase-like NADH-dependent reductase (Old Yellow Enzyme family)